MTTTNILILSFSGRDSDQEKNARLAEAAAAQMQKGYEASIEMVQNEPLFTKGYWLCNQGHKFAQDQYRSPTECSVCQTRIFKWIPGPGLSES